MYYYSMQPAQELDIHRLFDSYKETNNICLCIITAGIDNAYHSSYVRTLLSTQLLLLEKNIKHAIVCTDFKNNKYTTMNEAFSFAIHRPEYTHVLYIDSNVEWEPTDILKLIVADKRVCGVVCPEPSYNWGRITKNSDKLTQYMENPKENEHNISSILTNHKVNYGNASIEVVVSKNLMQVNMISTNLLLVSVDVLNRMADLDQVLRYDTPYCDFPTYTFFISAIIDNKIISEEETFFRNIKETNYTIWADVTIKNRMFVNHCFHSDFITYLISDTTKI